jgi:hypothetical protein
MAEENHWTTTIQIAVDAATVVRLALSPDQGEIKVNPKPEPRSIKTAVAAVAANAPAKIGPHAIAGFDASSTPAGATLTTVAMTLS